MNRGHNKEKLEKKRRLINGATSNSKYNCIKSIGPKMRKSNSQDNFKDKGQTNLMVSKQSMIGVITAASAEESAVAIGAALSRR